MYEKTVECMKTNKTALDVWKQPVMYENNLWFMKTASDVWKHCDV